MKDSTREKIQESINDLKEFGGFEDPELKKVIKKLKKVLEDEEKSEK